MFQRYVKIRSKAFKEGDRFEWMARNKTGVYIILICATIGCIYSLIMMNKTSYWLLVFMGFLSLFYVVKLPWNNSKNLRDIPSLKIFLIGIVWALTATALPYVNIDNTQSLFPWLLLVAQFVFIIGITIPFDIRDIILDDSEKKTIPQLLGEKGAIGLAVILILINTAIIFVYAPNAFLTISVGTIISVWLVIKSNRNRSDLYFSFLVDGLLLLQPMLLLIDLTFLKGII